MTRAQLTEVAAWRSSPLTSKTMWTIYVGQLSLAFLAWRVSERGPAWLLAVIASWMALLAITGVAGLSWTDPAVRIARVLARAYESPPPASGGAS